MWGYESGQVVAAVNSSLIRQVSALTGLLGLALLAALLAFPQTAGASTASLSGGVLTITAGPGETNAVVVEVVNASPITVSDTAGVTPGGGCEFLSATRVYCNASQQSPTSIVVSLGDGNDSFTNQEASSYTTSVNADGGAGDDKIDASGTANHVVRGGDGNDNLSGSSGDDQVLGEAGNDTVRGYAGADTVSGGPGVDLIEGDGSPIYLNGGSDTIDSRDGERDTVNCGFGTDSVTADSIDVIDAVECESVDKGAPGPSPAPDPAAAPIVELAGVSGAKLSKLLSRSGFAFRFSVSGPCTAVVKLTVAAAEARRARLGRRALTLVRDTAAIPEAGTFEGALEPAAKYRRKLRSLRRLKTTLWLSCSSAGQTGQVSKKITFKR